MAEETNEVPPQGVEERLAALEAEFTEMSALVSETMERLGIPPRQQSSQGWPGAR